MSGDVQPRKRKDKKLKKRDSLDRKSAEGESLFSRKQSLQGEDDEILHHGVHATKMGSDDVHLHIQKDSSTGGHWCAKVFFFSLLAVLLGLIGLIILENRGLSDLDTPLSESRFSDYFEGWVDENRNSHDDHEIDKVAAELDDHEHDGDPFDEEEEQSGEEPLANEENHDDDEEEADDEEEEDHTTEVDEKNDDTEENESAELNDDDEEDTDKTLENDDSDDDEEKDDEKDDEKSAEEVQYSRVRRHFEESSEPAKNEENDDIDEGLEDDDDTETEQDDENVSNGDADNNDKEDSDDNDKNSAHENEEEKKQSDNDPFDELELTKKNIKEINNKNLTPDLLEKQVDELYDVYKKLAQTLNLTNNVKAIIEENERQPLKKEDDDDEDFDESLEEVYENDAGEKLHLQQQKNAREESLKVEKQTEKEQAESSSLAVKIGVGIALAFAAHLVLVKRKNLTDKTKTETSEEESIISSEEDKLLNNARRRLSINVNQPFDGETEVEDEELIDENLEEDLDEEFMEEEEQEEEIEYSEDDEGNDEKTENFIPETFEQLNAMYRGKTQQPANVDVVDEAFIPKIVRFRPESRKSVSPGKDDQQIESLVSLEVKKEISTIQETSRRASPKPQFGAINPPSSSPVRENSMSTDQGTHSRLQQSVPAANNTENPLDDAACEEDDYDDEVYSENEEEVDLDEEDEDDLSEVDDEELLLRLEAKYGKLPERQYDSEEDEEDPSWTKIRSKAGGGPQDFDEDAFIVDELRRGDSELLQDNLHIALKIFNSLFLKYPDVPRALYGKAKVLDRLSEKHQSNQLLGEAIEAYKRFLSLENLIDDKSFREAAERCIDRMRFRGMQQSAIAIHDALVKRFPDDPYFRNQLAVTYLLNNRLSDAKGILHETLLKWPNDGFALVHYGFVLKNHDNDLEEAIIYLRLGIESGANGTQDGRFYFHLGDALQRLDRQNEAIEVYRQGSVRNLFLSEYQRSLYNVNHLTGRPFWTVKETTYEKYFKILEENWQKIRDEGLQVLNEKGFFMDEAESLKDTGDWKQFELFARGHKNINNCKKAPFTCNIIETFPAARFCKRGQVKFSVMHPGTHVWPHCGPTNCRLRAHLGLKVPSGTSIRVEKESRTWRDGEILIFDDSFEHEVWHNGTQLRLILIVDVWHPELTDAEKNDLSPI